MSNSEINIILINAQGQLEKLLGLCEKLRALHEVEIINAKTAIAGLERLKKENKKCCL